MTAYTATLAKGLRDCVAAALDPPVSVGLLVPGQEATWDKCCEGAAGGQAWVAPQRIYPTGGTGATFPAQQVSRFRCGNHMLAFEMKVGVLRCSQALTTDGQPPSPTRMEMEADRQYADHEAVLGAILCCFVPNVLPEAHPWVLGEWRPVGPQGGCVGGTTSLTVAVIGCPDCPEGSP